MFFTFSVVVMFHGSFYLVQIAMKLSWQKGSDPNNFMPRPADVPPSHRRGSFPWHFLGEFWRDCGGGGESSAGTNLGPQNGGTCQKQMCQGCGPQHYLVSVGFPRTPTPKMVASLKRSYAHMIYRSILKFNGMFRGFWRWDADKTTNMSLYAPSTNGNLHAYPNILETIHTGIPLYHLFCPHALDFPSVMGFCNTCCPPGTQATPQTSACKKKKRTPKLGCKCLAWSVRRV